MKNNTKKKVEVLAANIELTKKYWNIEGMRHTRNDCFHNCMSNFFLLKDLLPACKYVEGLIFDGKFIFQHSWLETPKGIIECTIGKNDKHYHFRIKALYFPIARYSREETVKALLKPYLVYPPLHSVLYPVLLQNKLTEAMNYLKELGKEFYFIGQEQANNLIDSHKAKL